MMLGMRTASRTYLILLLLSLGAMGAVYAALFPSQARSVLGLPGPEPTLATLNTAPVGSISLVVEPQDGITPVLSLIQNASTSVDMVMYELTDPEVEQALLDAKNRGIAVRVLLNEGYYGKQTGDYGAPVPVNQPAYEYLESHGIAVKWTPVYFALTHQKTLVVDGSEALIMSFNLVPRYYATGRDFGIDDTDQADVAAIEKTFNDDWAGEQDAAPQGDDLLWSPGSKDIVLSLIRGASSTLAIYNEEMNDQDIVNALEAAAKRGVEVRVDMTYATNWKPAFTELAQNGVLVRTYASSSKDLYIHAKTILVDNRIAFIGSENFSAGSLNDNRELGIVLSQKDILASLQDIFNTDWSGARPFVSQ
jgi:phosphatidylserine/phosphatidylglycerophosphate/cardiolipin synthase-like enzyme